jgi:hypothetical protein
MNPEVKLRGVINLRPYPVPIEMRPLWRICLILNSISVVSGDKRYLDAKKLNILVWMLIRKARWSEYEDFLCGNSSVLPLVSVDTATYKAVEFSIAKGFIKLGDGRFHITEEGVRLRTLLMDNEIMSGEVVFLREVGRKLTNEKVKKLTGELL